MELKSDYIRVHDEIIYFSINGRKKMYSVRQVLKYQSEIPTVVLEEPAVIKLMKEYFEKQ